MLNLCVFSRKIKKSCFLKFKKRKNFEKKSLFLCSFKRNFINFFDNFRFFFRFFIKIFQKMFRFSLFFDFFAIFRVFVKKWGPAGVSKPKTGFWPLGLRFFQFSGRRGSIWPQNVPREQPKNVWGVKNVVLGGGPPPLFSFFCYSIKFSGIRSDPLRGASRPGGMASG